MAQKFGQHFLSNPTILDRIARLICEYGGSEGKPDVLEIGPGRGALTERLLTCAGRITALEIDPELAAHLRSRFAESPNLTLIRVDALTTDFSSYHPHVVAGNLPYYVATPLIERTVRARLPGVFLIQKEVAQRLVAKPGGRDYGYLTVQTQLFADSRLMFLVRPGAFNPPPKVDSAVVALTPSNRAAELGIEDAQAFLSFLSACFRQKRKTLRNNLRSQFPIDDHSEAARRAEELSIDEFASLWHRLR